MKVKRPAKEVEVCDVCQRDDGYLQTCLVCGGVYCLTCDAVMVGCWVKPPVCRDCAKRPDVQGVVARAADKITPIIARRKAALKRLRAKPVEKKDGRMML